MEASRAGGALGIGLGGGATDRHRFSPRRAHWPTARAWPWSSSTSPSVRQAAGWRQQVHAAHRVRIASVRRLIGGDGLPPDAMLTLVFKRRDTGQPRASTYRPHHRNHHPPRVAWAAALAPYPSSCRPAPRSRDLHHDHQDLACTAPMRMGLLTGVLRIRVLHETPARLYVRDV